MELKTIEETICEKYQYDENYDLTDILKQMVQYLDAKNTINFTKVSKTFRIAGSYWLKRHKSATIIQAVFRDNKIYREFAEDISDTPYGNREVLNRKCWCCGKTFIKYHYLFYTYRRSIYLVSDGAMYCSMCFRKTLYQFYKKYDCLPMDECDSGNFVEIRNNIELTPDEMRMVSKMVIPTRYNIGCMRCELKLIDGYYLLNYI